MLLKGGGCNPLNPSPGSASGIPRTDQRSVWYTFERASKSSFLLQKRKFSFIGAHMPN